jgi:hypothetical protein
MLKVPSENRAPDIFVSCMSCRIPYPTNDAPGLTSCPMFKRDMTGIHQERCVSDFKASSSSLGKQIVCEDDGNCYVFEIKQDWVSSWICFLIDIGQSSVEACLYEYEAVKTQRVSCISRLCMRRSRNAFVRFSQALFLQRDLQASILRRYSKRVRLLEAISPFLIVSCKVMKTRCSNFLMRFFGGA